jgi:hypothetical protein
MVRIITGLAFAATASAAPELGCYYYKFPNPKMNIQAQVDVKSASQMDFSVYMKVGKQEVDHSCSGESFAWSEADQKMVVGEPASACLLKLQSMTLGALDLPVSFNYNSGAKSFKATFLGVPVELVKVSTCSPLPITPTLSPNETTAGPSANDSGDSPSGAADPQAPTKNFEGMTIAFAMIIALAGLV